MKRSLLLWPAAASVTITAVSWLPTQLPRDQNYAAPPKYLAALVAPAQFETPTPSINVATKAVEVTARKEHGVRAMPLPERVATALGAPRPGSLPSSWRGSDQERIGLSPLRVERTPHQGLGDFSAREVAQRVLDGDMLAATELAEADSSRAIDVELHQPEVQSLLSPRSPSDRATQSASLGRKKAASSIALNPPLLSSPSREEFWDTEINLIDPQIEARPASVLPKSTRVLGRRILNSPALDEPGSGLSDYDAIAEVEKSLTDDVTHSQVVQTPAPVDSPDRVFPIIVDHSERANEPVSPSDGIAGREMANPAGWPVATKLHEQLKTLNAMAMNEPSDVRQRLASASMSMANERSQERISDWTEDVSARLEELRALPRLGDASAGPVLDNLRELAAEGQRRAESLDDRGQQVQWLRTSFALARRMAVWQLVWQVTRGDNAWLVGDLTSRTEVSFQDAIANVRSDLAESGDEAGWNRYLLLDEIEASSAEASVTDRTVLAQRFLSRLQWHRLSQEQLRWLERDSLGQMAALVRPWAQDAVDYAQLLKQIERQESVAIDLATIDIAAAVQTLRFADNPLANRIAETIDTYYRNANVRIALSDDIIQRAMPTIEPRQIPVNTRILGSRVRGNSQINSDLAIKLVPAADRWNLKLRTDGTVATRSIGMQSRVAVTTDGSSSFQAETPIVITPQDIAVEQSKVDVRGRTRLRGVRTDYDGWPLIGSLVQSIAENRYQSLAPQANRIANRTMRDRISSEIDDQLEVQVDDATTKLSQLVLGPLGRLELDPMVMDMQTTDQRLLARFRVAGDWQMAACTPRPRAPSTSWMSVQVHQSALNNTLEQLVPKGERLTIREFVHRASEILGHQDVPVPDDIPENVTIQFSRTRPVTIEIQENRVWITLRVVRLKRDDMIDLTQFIVRACYRPQINGLQASLVRDGHLRISGPRMSMRERLPARTIFNKVLSSNREIPITLPALVEHPAVEGLAISQLELRSGWIGLAVSEEDAPRIALAP